ncbi:low molecular weight protein-tyrosine-phosphatase [Flavobacterium difficile]|uniref:protein-tyrosine-phosphatase n=1 Tax=Flavobacterium difficile TaxID=2709659 RepID=A0ABX0I1S9_9FLAO|nr:low molecular weight protein-tyrosine-phosphatase [Flavobacterium difficile]NHM01148.1 low molecular weight phosphotyrosine protein phosphatase [Flavobacterium difficile]
MSVKVLMVCLGNICRSPLAEGILKAKLPNNYIVDSAGTANYHVGSAPDKRSIAVAKKFGVDISQQKCRQITTSDFETFDYIYVMDTSNYKNVMAIAPNEEAKQKVKVILNELHPNKNLEVPDPYYGEMDGFEHVYKLLDEVCEAIAAKIKA